MDDATLWKDNIYPGPNYEPRIMTLPHFKPEMIGRVQYDYVYQCFTFTVVRYCGNGVYVIDTKQFGTIARAQQAKEIINTALGIATRYMYGILPEEPSVATLPATLLPNTIHK